MNKTQFFPVSIVKFQRQIEKALIDLCLGLEFSSTLPLNKSKTLYNYVAIYILVTEAKKERVFEFLVPLQVLCFITSNTVRSNTNKKPLLRKKSNAQKYYCDNDFTKTNYDILIHEHSVNC